MESQEFLYKILLLGDSAVGKTCFFMQYTENTFHEVHMSTVGLDHKTKNVQIDGKTYKIQIWDTAGQERFRTITKNYFKGAHGIILIYDVTSNDTFESVRNWIKQIKQEVDDKVCIILVGNKIDMEEQRVVTKEQGESMANEYGLTHYECSAKTGENVERSFNELVKKTVENFSKVAENIQLKKMKKKEKKCC